MSAVKKHATLARSAYESHPIDLSPYARHYLILAAFIAAICGGLYGYDTGIISGALLLITDDFHLGSEMKEIIASAILAGAIIGALGAGSLSERYGRRRCVILVSAVFVTGALACAYAPSVGFLIAARVFLGLAVGAATQVVPMYISELAPAERRGTLVTMFNVAIGIGILLANIVGLSGHERISWRSMIGLAAAPAAVVFCAMFFMPKSPRWIVENEGVRAAIDELSRIRTSKKEIRAEVKEMHENVQANDPRDAGWKGLFRPWVRPALVAALGVAFFTQCGGLEMMIYYTPTFLRDAGFDAHWALLASLGAAIVYCVMTFIGCLIVDRVGRRRLMLITGPGSIVGLVGLGIIFSQNPAPGSVEAYLLIVFLLVFMAFTSGGIQVCGWLLGSEMFPLSMRGQATSLHAATLWGSNLVVTGTALSLVNLISLGGTMWFYAFVNVVATLFIFFFVPETSGASLEDIEKALRGHRFRPIKGRVKIAESREESRA